MLVSLRQSLRLKLQGIGSNRAPSMIVLQVLRLSFGRRWTGDLTRHDITVSSLCVAHEALLNDDALKQSARTIHGGTR